MAPHNVYDYEADTQADAMEDLPTALISAAAYVEDFSLFEIASARRCAENLPNMSYVIAELETIRTALRIARNLSLALAARVSE